VGETRAKILRAIDARGAHAAAAVDMRSPVLAAEVSTFDTSNPATSIIDHLTITS
jgi:hypothetical protein